MSEETDPEKGQSLVEHLTELRIRLINSLYAIILGFAVCYYFSEQIFNVIRGPIQQYLPQGGLIFTGPMDKFMAHIKLSFMGAIILTCPFWLYQVWLFVAPALYKKEKRYAAGFIMSGSILFLMGSLFTYFVVLPMAFKFLMTYGGETDKPMISIQEYMAFFSHTCLAFGAAFEMPLLISTLGMLGLVSKKFLQEKRRYAIMLIAIISAVIAPPDLLSMVLLLIPMVALYEISVFVVGVFEKKRQQEKTEY
jgi:sec-independent protein translocase protein TatC